MMLMMLMMLMLLMLMLLRLITGGLFWRSFCLFLLTRIVMTWILGVARCVMSSIPAIRPALK